MNPGSLARAISLWQQAVLPENVHRVKRYRQEATNFLLLQSRAPWRLLFRPFSKALRARVLVHDFRESHIKQMMTDLFCELLHDRHGKETNGKYAWTMYPYSSARRFFAVHLFAVAGICCIAGYSPVQLLAGQADGSIAFAGSVPSASRHYARRYEATAYISLLSVNIFARSGVGFGYARVDEDVFAKNRNVSLRFLSGSIPERAHGLNRFGFIQENIKERDGICAKADYFGLITANGEESLSQAKVALETTSQTTAFVAAQATIDPQSARYSIRHMMLPSIFRGVNVEQLLDDVRASFDRSEIGQPEHHQALNGDIIGTFLYSIREAILAPSDKLQKRFLYNGKTFDLLTEKRADEKASRELHAAGLIGPASSSTLLIGVIRNETTNELTNFRLWFDPASPDFLPLRFEFRPKSYLRLVFQAMPPTTTPTNRITATAALTVP
jgi:hypothetical protein